MATKQFWTLQNADNQQTADDILSPTIRYPLVNDRRMPVFKNRVQQFGTTEHTNNDHIEFVNWLHIQNHKRSKQGKPILEVDKFSAELFLTEHPEYKVKRAFRHRAKVA